MVATTECFHIVVSIKCSAASLHSYNIIAVPNLYAFCLFLLLGYVSFGFCPSVNAGFFQN